MVAHFGKGTYSLKSKTKQEYLEINSENWYPSIKGGIGRFTFSPVAKKVKLGKFASYEITFDTGITFTGTNGDPVCTARDTSVKLNKYVYGYSTQVKECTIASSTITLVLADSAGKFLIDIYNVQSMSPE